MIESPSTKSLIQRRVTPPIHDARISGDSEQIRDGQNTSFRRRHVHRGSGVVIAYICLGRTPVSRRFEANRKRLPNLDSCALYQEPQLLDIALGCSVAHLDRPEGLGHSPAFAPQDIRNLHVSRTDSIVEGRPAPPEIHISVEIYSHRMSRLYHIVTRAARVCMCQH